MKILKVDLNFEIEPTKTPLGFKGGYLTHIWQTVVGLSTSENKAIGLGTQSVLWSDAEVFISNTQMGGNALMFAVSQYALNLIKGRKIDIPINIIEDIFPEVHQYACSITSYKKLRKTFTLNSLVAVDNALWVLYAKENNKLDFYEMIPSQLREPLQYKHEKLACIPLISYAVPLEDIKQMINEGFFFLKIKIGSDPEKDGDREKMLEWDKKRIESIHREVGNLECPFTENGKIPYYFDANGRYDNKERLIRLIEFLDKIKALEQVVIIEEPFPEEEEIDVSDLPVRIAADESAHTPEDTIKRAQMGYKAVALKPIAKTLSITLKILDVATKHGMEAFCADLTVIPPLVDWNKNLACRIKPLKGLKIPVVESNGHQHYRDWEKLVKHHSCYPSSWISPQNGIFILDNDFYKRSGGIFEGGEWYSGLLNI